MIRQIHEEYDSVKDKLEYVNLYTGKREVHEYFQITNLCHNKMVFENSLSMQLNMMSAWPKEQAAFQSQPQQWLATARQNMSLQHIVPGTKQLAIDLWSTLTIFSDNQAAVSTAHHPEHHVSLFVGPKKSERIIAVCAKVWNRVNRSNFASSEAETCSASISTTSRSIPIILVDLECTRWYLSHNVFYMRKHLRLKFICCDASF